MLDLSSNALTGPLLREVVAGLARELISLNLSNNSLSSQIPAEVALLTKLTDLYPGINCFTGEVRPAIGNLMSLCSLFLPMCYLRGPLPDAMVGLVSPQISTSLITTSPRPSPKLSASSATSPSSTSRRPNATDPSPRAQPLHQPPTLTLSFNSLVVPLGPQLSRLLLLSFSTGKNLLFDPTGVGGRVAQRLLALPRQQPVSDEIPPALGKCALSSPLSLGNNRFSGRIFSELCDAVPFPHKVAA